jgi:5'-nucleotidase
MRILVTNDDGIEAPGICTLAAALASAGHEPIVAAPSKDQSGAGTSIWRMHHDAHIEVAKVELGEAPQVEAWSVAAPPGLIVLTGVLEAFGPCPDLVMSGINAGLNTGHAILHSGTVGAVMTAQRLGVSAMAVSLAPGEPWQWQTAAHLALAQLDSLAALPRGTAINLNVPNGDGRELPEVRWASLDKFGSVRIALADNSNGKLQLELRTTGNELRPDSDAALIEQGFATLTMISGVQECPEPPDADQWPMARVERTLAKVPASSAPVEVTGVGTAEPKANGSGS